MKKIVLLALVFWITASSASQVILEPLTEVTLQGTWEALSESPAVFFHMEISSGGDSYLVQTYPKSDVFILRRLLSHKVEPGRVTLHFGEPTSAKIDKNFGLTDVWIVGEGEASATEGQILGWFDLSNDAPSPNEPVSRPNIRFVKGNWTRDLAAASLAAERVVREKISNK